MNDFEYDCYQKKVIARGAKHCKGTINRKGCTLPHEYLTKKEREQMNGELSTIQMNSPISWERFKTLPKDLQEEYLQRLMDSFGVGASIIGHELFGVSQSGLRKHINKYGLRVKARSGGRVSKAVYENWRSWLNGSTDLEPTIAPVIEEPEEPVKDVKLFRAHDHEPPAPPTIKVDELQPINLHPLTDMNLTLKGTPVDVLTALRLSFPALLDADLEYRFNISVNVCARERRPEHL